MVWISGPEYNLLIIAASILVPASMIGLMLGLLRDLRRRNLLQRGLVHIVFLADKQRRFLVQLSMLGAFFIASGIVDALGGIGAISPTMQTVLSSVTYIGGALALFLLILTSLRPGELTEEQAATLAWLPLQYYPTPETPIEARIIRRAIR